MKTGRLNSSAKNPCPGMGPRFEGCLAVASKSISGFHPSRTDYG